ncbi:unnamed protein product [Cochlearia groenlandica]
MNSFFIDRFRHSSKQDSLEEEEEEEEEESPTELNTINSSGGFVTVSPDNKLSIKYNGAGQHGHNVGVVQSNKPAPCKRLAYYFEIYVKDGGVKGRVAIGFTTDRSFLIGRHPGWEHNTCGYHGEEGLIYLGKQQGEAFGPTYTTGDIVGGGINYDSNEFFFTVNGALVGTVSKYIKGPLFPTVAVHSQNEEVTVNFGQEKFAFDLKGYEASERNKRQLAIEKISIPPNMNHRLVKNYLLHHGYVETLHAFDLATNSTVPPICLAQEDGIDTSYELHERKILRQLIGKGEIASALVRLRACYPQLVQDDKSELCFLLHCQNFIELVRTGALEEAVIYGRTELAKFIGATVFKDIVEDCFALLVYEHPEESNVGYFLDSSQREVVADAVNAAILATDPKGKEQQLHSRLETLLRQLMTCCLELRSLNDGQGESLSLNRFLKNNSCKRMKKTG